MYNKEIKENSFYNSTLLSEPHELTLYDNVIFNLK